MRLAFRKDFVWGAAAASYQIGEAAFEEGCNENEFKPVFK